jgi:hypothetical protein
MSTNEWTFRLATPADAASFAKWIAENSSIDAVDKLAATHDQNPTVLWFVMEKDGIVQAFAPLYLQMTLPHLGFNPDAAAEDRKEALTRLMNGVSAFAVQFGIREITTLSKERYPIAKWAIAHGFDLDSRQVLKLDLNKVMASAV